VCGSNSAITPTRIAATRKIFKKDAYPKRFRRIRPIGRLAYYLAPVVEPLPERRGTSQAR